MDVAMDDVQRPPYPPADPITPTAPRVPLLAPAQAQPQAAQLGDLAAQKTPTGDSLASGAGGEKRPLDPSSEAGHITETSSKTRNRKSFSHHGPEHRTSQDANMEDDDVENGGASDNESAIGDSSRPSKKKKGQRFFCTEYPPCQLSFTRSEHLARHVR